LCETVTSFSSHITSNEAGKVMISLTNKAGGAPASSGQNSAVLHKACVLNGGTIPTDATLANML
jgi:hypothetical protein